MTNATIPGGDHDPTPGETRLFTYLQQALAKQPGASVQLRRHTGGREIDLLVLLPRVGFVVIEVKDWSADQIAGAGAKMRIATSRGMKSPDSPLKQAREGAIDLMRELEARDRRLRRSDPKRPRLGVRWGAMCALPNITEDAWEGRGLDRYIQRHTVFLADDFERGGVLLDPSGAAVIGVLSRQAGGRPPLSDEEFARLADALAPFVVAPPRPGPGRLLQSERLGWLSKQQLREADRPATDPTVLRGPAGSGKTLVLVERACNVARSSPGRNVLLTCYGIVLAANLRRLVLSRGVGVGTEPGTVYVTHFDGLVGRVLGRQLDFGTEDRDYYVKAREDAARAVDDERHGLPPFDAVLVDEGQDMADDMIRTLLALRAVGGEFLATLDERQSLFPRQRTWHDGLDGVRFASRDLKQSYRSTAVLRRFLARVFDEEVPTDEPERDAYFSPPPPRFHRAESASALAYFVAEDIARHVKEGAVPFGEIAILYHDKWSDAADFHRGKREFVEELLERLAVHAVPGAWVSQDQHSKALYDATSDRVAVMSYHSAKGLEFDVVYVLGADRLDETLADREEVDAYLRCALTRARYELVVPYVQLTESVTRLTAAASLV